jgi:hypothetical protein
LNHTECSGFVKKYKRLYQCPPSRIQFVRPIVLLHQALTSSSNSSEAGPTCVYRRATFSLNRLSIRLRSLAFISILLVLTTPLPV